MLICNNKFVLNHTLNPSTYLYNPDDGQLIFRQGDPRDVPIIKYSVNNGTEQTGSLSGTYLRLPSYDTEYNLKVKFSPSSTKYTGTYEYTSKVYMNNPACKNFVYNEKYGDEVIEYQGTDGTIIVPPKHNMVATKKVTLKEFPTVTSSSITIETPESINNVNITANSKITGLNLKGLISSTTRQFANFTGLKTFTGRLSSVSERMFENDSKLTTVNISDATLVGSYAFKGCSSLTTVNMPNLTTVHSHGFENCTKLKSINLKNCVGVGSYGFAGCTGLGDFHPSEFSNINILDSYAFYDTPIKKIRLKTSTLPVGCFDYSKNPFEKIIFTSSFNINGLNNNTLRDGVYTDGMLYNGNKKHQIYCGVTDELWSDDPSDGTIIHGGYDKNKNGNVPMTPGEHKFDFYTDNNAFGLEVSTVDENNQEKKFRTIGGFESTSIGRRWSVDKSNLFGNRKPSFYSELKVKYIDNEGLHDTGKEFFIYGDKVPEPLYKVKLVYAVDGTKAATSYKFTKNGSTYISGKCPKGHYYIWLAADAKNTNISMVAIGTPTETQAGSPVLGLNGQGIQHLNLQVQDRSTESQGFILYKADLADYYNLTELYEKGWGDASFFYREYRIGYQNIDDIYGNSWKGTLETVEQYPKLNSWKDCGYVNYSKVSSDYTRPELVFWTTKDNTTLYLNGEVFQENVPAYRMYFKTKKECPRLLLKLFLYKNTNPYDDSDTDPVIVYRYAHNINENFGYIDLMDIEPNPADLFYGESNTYTKFSPNIRLGYAHNSLEDSFAQQSTTIYLTKSVPSAGGVGTPKTAITSVFDDELSPEFSDVEYAVPPANLPDTKTAYIGIEKVFCNMNTSGYIEGTYTPTGETYNVWDEELWLHYDSKLVLRVEVYDENNKFLYWFDGPQYYSITGLSYNEDVYKLLPTAWPVDIKKTYKLKIYYRDNPSYGKFTIDLTNKSRY